jgi:hypothetical protein
MSELRKKKAEILNAMSVALDQCILQAEERPELAGCAPTKLQAELTFRFDGGSGTQITCRPSLDLTRPIGPQLDTRAKIIEKEPYEEPADDTGR